MPYFSKLGKDYSDLFKKGFDTNNKISIVSKTDFGLKLTLDGNVGKGEIQGVEKAEYTDKKWGKAEAELNTASGKAWGTATFDSLYPGAELSVSGGFDPSSSDALIKAAGGCKLEGMYKYNKDMVCATGRVFAGWLTLKDKSVDENVSVRVEGDVVMGTEGLWIGAAFKNTIGDQVDDMNVNIGCELQTKDFTATLQTEKMADVMKLSWCQNISKDFTIGAELVSDEFGRLSADRRRTLNFASKYKLNSDVSLMFRANNYGEVGAGVEKVLKDPRVKVQAGAAFTAKGSSSFVCNKFGMAFTFGDF